MTDRLIHILPAAYLTFSYRESTVYLLNIYTLLPFYATIKGWLMSFCYLTLGREVNFSVLELGCMYKNSYIDIFLTTKQAALVLPKVAACDV